MKYIIILAVLLLAASGISAQSSDDFTIYRSPDVLPVMKGGDNAITDYLKTNVNYPQSAINKCKQGTVYASFIVRKSGSLDSITILRSPAPELSDEVIRIIKNMPRWIPGKMGTVAVDAYYMLPVVFKLDSAAKPIYAPTPVKDIKIITGYKEVGYKAPVYPGDKNALNTYFSAKLLNLYNAKHIRTSDTEYVSFTINNKGYVQDIHIENDTLHIADTLYSVLSDMPEWRPASNKEFTTDYLYKLAICFNAQQSTTGHLSTFMYKDYRPEYTIDTSIVYDYIYQHLAELYKSVHTKDKDTLYAIFDILADGKVSNITIEHMIPGMTDAVINTIKQIPPFSPATISGKHVIYSFTLPFEFSIDKYGQVSIKHKDIEIMPQFPGGDQALMKFLAHNISYPQAAREQNISGTTYLHFIVDEDGIISDIKVLKEVGGGCTTEAIRVVKAMPQWTPGMQDGHKVKVSYTLPVVFQLNEGR